MSFTDINKMGEIWYVKFDYVSTGYYLFVIGSILYFYQALSPSIGAVEDSHYYYGPIETKVISSAISIIAAIIFLIESVMYMVGFYYSRTSEYVPSESIELNKWYSDWNFIGNTLNLIGSFLYLLTGIGVKGQDEIDVVAGVIFVIDSFIYLIAIIDIKNSIILRSYEQKIFFNSSFDYYFLSTLLFIFGSVVYLAAAIETYLKQEKLYRWNMLASCIFLIDAPLYLLSSFQLRHEENEINLLSRRHIFYVELINNDDNTNTFHENQVTFISPIVNQEEKNVQICSPLHS